MRQLDYLDPVMQPADVLKLFERVGASGGVQALVSRSETSPKLR